MLSVLRSPPLLLALGPWLAALVPLVLPIARNFEYEYVTLVSYLVLLLLPMAALLLHSTQAISRRQWLLGLFIAPWLAPLPAWLALQSGLCLCSQREFWLWWLLQFLPHLSLGQAAFLLIFRLRSQGYSRRICSTLVLSILAALLLHLGWNLWMHPQKRITHMVAGFIHGAIYDNWIPLDAGIILARATHLLIALSCMSLLAKFRWRVAVTGTLLLLAGGTGYRSLAYPSQSHGLAALTSLMPASKSGQRFTLHYREPNSELQRLRLEELYDSTVFHMKDLSGQLLVYDTHVHIFVYPSRGEKKLWFGGDGTDITDVVTPSIHINLESWPHSTLRHELVHALSSSFAFHGLGFHPNLAFTEGLAVALAPHEEDLSLHAGAASLLMSGRLSRPTALFSPLFWSESGRRAYTVAGSILKFLIDRYGIGKIKMLYGGETWHQVFGADASSILKDWQRFLQQNYPPMEDAITAEALFRYPGIFDDVCPHSKAMLMKNPDEWLVQWRQPHRWLPERDYWPWRQQISRDPEVELATLQAKAAAIWADFSPEKAQGLLEHIETFPQGRPRSLEDIEIFLLRIDTLAILERYAEALTLLQDYQKLLTSYQVGDTLVRQLWVRHLLLLEPPDEARAWLRLLAGFDPQAPPWNRNHQSWIIRYLYLRNYHFGPRQQALLEYFAKMTIPKGLPPTFAVEWHRSLGMQWMRGGSYSKAEQAFLQAAALAPEGKRKALTLYAVEAGARDDEGQR